MVVWTPPPMGVAPGALSLVLLGAEEGVASRIF